MPAGERGQARDFAINRPAAHAGFALAAAQSFLKAAGARPRLHT